MNTHRWLAIAALAIATLTSQIGRTDQLSVSVAGFVTADGAVISATPSNEGELLADEMDDPANLSATRRRPRIDLGLQSVMANENLDPIIQTGPGSLVYLIGLFQDALENLTPCRKIDGNTINAALRVRGVLRTPGWIDSGPILAECQWVGIIWEVSIPTDAPPGTFTVSHRVRIKGFRVRHGKARADFSLQ